MKTGTIKLEMKAENEVTRRRSSAMSLRGHGGPSQLDGGSAPYLRRNDEQRPERGANYRALS